MFDIDQGQYLQTFVRNLISMLCRENEQKYLLIIRNLQ